MGTLTYPVHGVQPLTVDDRTLAHLQTVIGSKLRLKQGFFFSWTDQLDTGSGRSSIWIDSSVALRFTFATTERHMLNRVWLESLMASANSARGLCLTSEPKVIAVAA